MPVTNISQIDFTAPIDITAVLTAVAEHGDLLQAIDTLDASEVLQYTSPYPGVTNSLTLGKIEDGSVSAQYNGVFLGATSAGTVVPRTVTVYPIKIEMADEPERYRRSYMTEVRGGLYDGGHPFEIWLVQHTLALASQDLLNVLFTAVHNDTVDSEHNKPISDSFDGWGTITENEKTAGKISTSIGNEFATGMMTVSNIGDKLLSMWRSRPETFRNKNSVIFMSPDLVDMYTDWYESKYTFIAGQGSDETHPVYLRGTQGKCQICKAYGLPANSQWVLLTTQTNMIYAFDKDSDMNTVAPFASGNPYLFTMAGKYVFGTQFISIHKSEFCINDQPLTPVAG